MDRIEREYGVATTILFALWEPDGTDLITTASFAAGDVQVVKDEAAAANATNLPTHEGGGIYSLALTLAELQCARLGIFVVDQTATKVWLDKAILIETYGSSSAQHTQESINVSNGIAEANLKQIADEATAATKLGASAAGIVTGAVSGGTATTTSIPTNLTEATDDHFNRRLIVFTSGALAGQVGTITDYNGTSKALTVTTLTEAPADTDSFVIV